MKRFLLLSLVLLFTTTAFSQDLLKGKNINWQDLQTTIDNPTDKNILLFIYADWCEFCQKTADITLENKEFVSAMNTSVVPVKLNVNSKEVIELFNQKITFDEESGYHGLALILATDKRADGSSEIGLPSYVFLTPDFKMITKVSGYQDNPIEFSKFIDFIGENAHQKMTWEQYFNSVKQ